jgi:hypothetical protein
VQRKDNLFWFQDTYIRVNAIDAIGTVVKDAGVVGDDGHRIHRHSFSVLLRGQLLTYGFDSKNDASKGRDFLVRAWLVHRGVIEADIKKLDKMEVGHGG